jgi:hypothetical protein
MKQESISERPTRVRAVQALSEAFMGQHPDTSLDPKGYVADFRDTLLPQVTLKDFEADLSSGDGNELQTKFRAAHSSSGLAVNCFAPFRSRIADLAMPMVTSAARSAAPAGGCRSAADCSRSLSRTHSSRSRSGIMRA